MQISPATSGFAGVSGVGPVDVSGLSVSGLSQAGGAKESSFSKMMSEMLTTVQESQSKMDKDVAKLATGQAENVHDVVLNVAQADLMFRMVLEVRDKLISSYQDVMRMQI